MKTLFFLIFAFLMTSSSFAQFIVTLKNEDGYLKNADGSLVQKTTTFVEEGSKSLPERNCATILKTTDGKVYKNVKGHIDLETEKFVFLVNEQEFNCTLPIDQIVFDSCDAVSKPALFKTGYPAIDKQNEKSLYLVLSQGKATLLKHYVVTWQDITPFNTTNTTRTYKQMEQYYLFLNGKMVRLEKNKDNLRELLEIQRDYISLNKLNLKKDEDATKFVDYYNSL
ncbi:MAG: hypothetical protein M3040_00665 [Bacteroidota bacterium]|nr:hypothetical protein [Bacteroidota bacterium]